METFGDRLSLLISQCGKTKTEFAKKIKMSQPYVSQLCSGEKVPSDRTILTICRVFGVSETWIRTGEGEMFAKRTREEELGDFIADVLKDEPDSFRRRIVAILAKLTPSDWAAIEKRGREILDELEEEKKKPAP